MSSDAEFTVHELNACKVIDDLLAVRRISGSASNSHYNDLIKIMELRIGRSVDAEYVAKISKINGMDGIIASAPIMSALYPGASSEEEKDEAWHVIDHILATPDHDSFMPRNIFSPGLSLKQISSSVIVARSRIGFVRWLEIMLGRADCCPDHGLHAIYEFELYNGSARPETQVILNVEFIAFGVAHLQLLKRTPFYSVNANNGVLFLNDAMTKIVEWDVVEATTMEPTTTAEE